MRYGSRALTLLVSGGPGGGLPWRGFAPDSPDAGRGRATFGAAPTPAPMVLPIAQAVPSLFGGSMLPLFAALFLVMYFTMIRPQAKAAKAHRALVEGLAKGDRVVTQGGLHGTITRVDETTVVMSVEDGTRLRVERSRVAVVLAKDAPKEAAVSVN